MDNSIELRRDQLVADEACHALEDTAAIEWPPILEPQSPVIPGMLRSVWVPVNNDAELNLNTLEKRS